MKKGFFVFIQNDIFRKGTIPEILLKDKKRLPERDICTKCNTSPLYKNQLKYPRQIPIPTILKIKTTEEKGFKNNNHLWLFSN